MTVRIGISGWRYKGWRGSFYPSNLPQRSELSFASRQLASIELNGSFYALQTPASYRHWHDETPADFVFAVKGSRFITHMKRLRDVEQPLANFFASGVLALEDKLGPLLWQYPANLRWDEDTFEQFLRFLPHTMKEAARLAARHDDRVSPVRLKVTHDRRLRHAVEVRHESFADPAFVAQLRRHGVALVVADSAGTFPSLEDITAGFVYVRLHGDAELYASGYGEPALQAWADKIRLWAQGRQPRDATRCSERPPPRRKHRDVYVYFDNDAKGHAPFDALSLGRMLGRR